MFYYSLLAQQCPASTLHKCLMDINSLFNYFCYNNNYIYIEREFKVRLFPHISEPWTLKAVNKQTCRPHPFPYIQQLWSLGFVAALRLDQDPSRIVRMGTSVWSMCKHNGPRQGVIISRLKSLLITRWKWTEHQGLWESGSEAVIITFMWWILHFIWCICHQKYRAHMPVCVYVLSCFRRVEWCFLMTCFTIVEFIFLSVIFYLSLLTVCFICCRII